MADHDTTINSYRTTGSGARAPRWSTPYALLGAQPCYGAPARVNWRPQVGGLLPRNLASGYRSAVTS